MFDPESLMWSVCILSSWNCQNYVWQAQTNSLTNLAKLVQVKLPSSQHQQMRSWLHIITLMQWGLPLSKLMISHPPTQTHTPWPYHFPIKFPYPTKMMTSYICTCLVIPLMDIPSQLLMISQQTMIIIILVTKTNNHLHVHIHAVSNFCTHPMI